VRHLLQEGAWPMRLSVSATTRPKRPKEKDGKDYHYWTVERFLQEKDANGFLEWAKVHDNYYGTLVSEVTPYRERGEGVLLDIDVQGAAQVRQRCPDAVSIFVKTSRFETLEERLRQRHTETEEAIQKRLTNARAELARAGEYQHQVTNDDLESALASMRAILSPLFPKE
jgi:guanylate kinase